MNNNTWEKGCDFGFKVGQKAWHSDLGEWGEVIKSKEIHLKTHPFTWVSGDGQWLQPFMIDGCVFDWNNQPTIFHVEQTFDFSLPEWQPEAGELCWVWYSSDKLPTLAKFHRMNTNLYRCFNMSNLEVDYRHIAPFNNGQLPDEFKHLLKGGSDEG